MNGDMEWLGPRGRDDAPSGTERDFQAAQEPFSMSIAPHQDCWVLIL